MTGGEEVLAGKQDDRRPALRGPGGVAYLTQRQLQVLELAARGLGYKEIAACLRISSRCVEDRFGEMRDRTGISTTAALLAHAGKAGLVLGSDDVPLPMGTAAHPWTETAERGKTRTQPPRVRDETDQVLSRCRVCGSFVTVAPTGRPREYCSSACRARAYRSRHGLTARVIPGT